MTYQLLGYMDAPTNTIAKIYSLEYGYQMWTKCKVIKHKECHITKVPLKGTMAWSPVTNKSNRMHRISIDAMKTLPRVQEGKEKVL